MFWKMKNHMNGACRALIFGIMPKILARFHVNFTNFSFDSFDFCLNSLFLLVRKRGNEAKRNEKTYIAPICSCGFGLKPGG
jgi:hypothetical protein